MLEYIFNPPCEWFGVCHLTLIGTPHCLCLVHTGILMASAYCTPELSRPLLIAHWNSHSLCLLHTRIMAPAFVHWNSQSLLQHTGIIFSATILSIMSGKSLFNKLNETNYNDWKIQMEALLEEKGLFGVTCGRDVVPATWDHMMNIV